MMSTMDGGGFEMEVEVESEFEVKVDNATSGDEVGFYRVEEERVDSKVGKQE
jgi:hypothetical protein